jgi:hypothetical protein
MENYKLPERLDCVLTYHGKPIADLMLWAEFRTLRKNPYTIVYGPTDQQGRATLSYEDIKRQADSQQDLALMDFDPIERAFSGTITVKLMTYDDVQNAIRAYDMFKSVGWYPAHYREFLEAAKGVLRSIDSGAVHIEVSPIPDSIKVIV